MVIFLGITESTIILLAFVPAGVKFKLEKEIADLCDDDDGRCPSQGLHGEKANYQIIAENEHLKRVEMMKRKRASDIQPSPSTCT